MLGMMTTPRPLRSTPVNFGCPTELLDRVEEWAHVHRMPRAAAMRHLLDVGLRLADAEQDQLPGQTALEATP